MKVTKIFQNKFAQFIAFCGFFNASILGTLSTIFTETKSDILAELSQRFSFSKAQAEISLVLAVNAVIIIAWIVIQIICSKFNNGVMKIAVDDDSDGRRIEEFQRLRAKAKKNILVMGIGMSGVSKDVKGIEALLKEGKNISFLIMDPDVLIDSVQPAPAELDQQFQQTKISIDDKKLSEFHATGSYRKNISASIENLKNFVVRQEQRRKECRGSWQEGRIEVRKYPYYVPLNVTISDIDEPYSKLIVEFCLPFSTERIRAKLSHGKVKKLIENQMKELLRNSKLICESP